MVKIAFEVGSAHNRTTYTMFRKGLERGFADRLKGFQKGEEHVSVQNYSPLMSISLDRDGQWTLFILNCPLWSFPSMIATLQFVAHPVMRGMEWP